MNLPRYPFAKETEPVLLKFLRIAEEQKNSKNCDLDAYKIWRNLCPPDPKLLQDVKDEAHNISDIMDLCSDEELPGIDSVTAQAEEECQHAEEKSSLTDITFVIQENLQTHNSLDEHSKELLRNNNLDLVTLFEMLDNHLANDEVVHLGVSLKDMAEENLIIAFCNNLLFSRIKKEYSDKILNILNEFSLSHFSTLEDKWLSSLKTLTPEETDVTAEYLKQLNPTTKSKLARVFIFSLQKLDEQQLKIIEYILNNEIETEVISKLVELLSNIAERHSKDKNFGKLLLNVIEILGPHLLQLEQPLKYIISGHKSVWKSKLEKKFQTKYEDTMLFSQSFRD